MIYTKLSEIANPDFPHRFKLDLTEVYKFIQYTPLGPERSVSDAEWLEKWLDKRPFQEDFHNWCRDTIDSLPMAKWTVTYHPERMENYLQCALYFRTAGCASMFKLMYGGV